MVIIREPNLPPLNWSLGRDEELPPGEDGISRIVSIRTTKGVVKRAITNICPLVEMDNKQ